TIYNTLPQPRQERRTNLRNRLTPTNALYSPPSKMRESARKSTGIRPRVALAARNPRANTSSGGPGGRSSVVPLVLRMSSQRAANGQILCTMAAGVTRQIVLELHIERL